MQSLHARWRVASESRVKVNAVNCSTVQPEKWACLGQGTTAERRKTDIIQSLISPERHNSGVDGITLICNFPRILFGFCMIIQQ